ncbi:prepilin-type N-terminal cleavage/methylation domain-containing protein [Planomonospora corallina]|uniref:Prepilin-type N-terminal cleavage/methylation domain-containing protein n=1 Tax=Planomonospora corallina TaxID=1806052 RepID=A0ABV8I581_9ACTN
MKAALQRLQKRAHGDRGFTLIELLVVVVIIGVLVAIAIPVYMNYTKGAADKSAQSDVRSAITAVESYYTMNGNKYPDSATNQDKGFSLGTGAATQQVAVSEGTTLTYVKDTGTNTYRICAKNGSGTGAVYQYDSAKGGAVKAAPGVTVEACGAAGAAATTPAAG